ncbi:MAG: hypothetical protein OXC83_13135 [Chloroflexi bacterium]|nr:hypothetical protein [Chloroflexota bacterium]
MSDIRPNSHERLRQVDPKLLEAAVARSNRALARLQTLAEHGVREALQAYRLDRENS